MIKELHVELKDIIYVTIYTLYLCSIIELTEVYERENKLKIIPKILLNIYMLIMNTITTYIFINELDNGYVSIYYILFIIIGILIYYIFIRDSYLKRCKQLSIYFHKLIIYLFNVRQIIYLYNFLKDKIKKKTKNN